MLRAATRDPLWAFVALIALPFRIWQTLLVVLFILIVALFVIGFGGRFFLEQWGFGPGSVPFIALDLVTLLVLAAIAFRFITNPLIIHFGDMEGETHGSARFATNRGQDKSSSKSCVKLERTENVMPLAGIGQGCAEI
ncbi:hypothetical protein [Sinorhizobium sp. KGO-5]|uniref:hypothetical protein n=1 Tax=Sinorhizobium sp. KGO-5 TaxID=1470810 RepID=UPI0030C724A1